MKEYTIVNYCSSAPEFSQVAKDIALKYIDFKKLVDKVNIANHKTFLNIESAVGYQVVADMQRAIDLVLDQFLPGANF